ncbi:hypothetical protein Fcan01_23896, partial [Folsomia candida]
SYDKAIKKLNKYIGNKPIDSSENEESRRRRRKASTENTNPGSEVDGTKSSAAASPQKDKLRNPHKYVQVIQLEPDPRIESLFAEFRKFQEESLRNEHLLLERVANLEKLVIKLTRLAASNCSDNTNINWPAKTLEELEQIEAILKTEKTIYNKEVCFLSKNNGKTLAQDVYAMLSSMIANDLRSKIRITDRNNKIPFENRLSAKLVRDAVKSGNSQVKDSQINQQMGCWFRMKITSKIKNADITTNRQSNNFSKH